jgi:hypothetical protein
MQGTELVVTWTLCLASGGFYVSKKNSCPASVGMSVLVCGQNAVILILFEGGLLCIRS